jgi:hypothetical protein
VPKPSALERELQILAGQLKKVETEYTMYFSGRTQRPPVESRAALDRAFKRVDRMTFDGPVSRFQFTSLQARYSSFADLWDRGVRAREEGRAGPFGRPPSATAGAAESGDQLLHAAVFADPMQELDKLRDLYEALMQARRDDGHAAVPFHRFAGLVREQVKTLQDKHPGDQIRFLVTRHDGKVNLTARAVKESAGGDGDG